MSLTDGEPWTTQRAETYGPFPGGDPRRFTPDREACTTEEIRRWEAACQEWREGRQEDAGPGCATFGDGSAITGSGFGVGMYDFGEMPDDDAIETIGLLEAENRELRQQLKEAVRIANDAVRIAEAGMEENRRLDLDLEKSNDAVMWHLAEQVELEGKLTRQRRRFIWAYWIVALVGVALGVCLTNAAWLLR